MTEINPTPETPTLTGLQLDIVSLLNDENFLVSITQWQEANEDSLEFDPETLSSIMADYVSAVIKSINLCLHHQIDTLVFLDKSARPISHTFNHLWDKISNSHVLVSFAPQTQN